MLASNHAGGGTSTIKGEMASIMSDPAGSSH